MLSGNWLDEGVAGNKPNRGPAGLVTAGSLRPSPWPGRGLAGGPRRSLCRRRCPGALRPLSPGPGALPRAAPLGPPPRSAELRPGPPPCCRSAGGVRPLPALPVPLPGHGAAAERCLPLPGAAAGEPGPLEVPAPSGSPERGPGGALLPAPSPFPAAPAGLAARAAARGRRCPPLWGGGRCLLPAPRGSRGREGWARRRGRGGRAARPLRAPRLTETPLPAPRGNGLRFGRRTKTAPSRRAAGRAPRPVGAAPLPAPAARPSCRP